MRMRAMSAIQLTVWKSRGSLHRTEERACGKISGSEYC